MRVLALVALVAVTNACGPAPTKRATSRESVRPAKPARCPDPNLRDKNNPCSPMYLAPHQPRLKADMLK